MAKKANEARPGDVLVKVRCCNGSVLVKYDAVARWFCGSCGGHGTQVGRFKYEKDMTLVELSTKETRSYT